MILSDAGFDVIAESSPVQAMKDARNLSFDLALIDYQMPQMTGAELSLGLRRIYPDVPIVMISGFGDLPASELIHVDAFYGRSSSLNELLETIEVLTGTPVRSGKTHHAGAASMRGTF
jgi:DNA-binding NarL/FixJ family response regulator